MSVLWWILPAGLLWAVIVLLPWRPWGTRERLDADPREPEADSSDVVVLIPARNEAVVLARTLHALARQGRGLAVVVVDDQSSDGTAGIAARSDSLPVTVVHGRPVPDGWTGKVWALEQGRPYLHRPLTLLLDADIELAPGMVPALRRQLRRSGAGMVSVMAQLPMDGWWERLLVPAFVYFFKLLYPFGLSPAPRSRVAAAAGGCVLLETGALDAIGGFGALRDALIDDCRLARLVKARGCRPWIGLTRSARSTRSRSGLGDIWHMVSRTAYTQLGYAPSMLLLCTLLMVTAFLLPVAGLFAPSGADKTLAAAVCAAMVSTYVPTLRFYGLAPVWALSLPLSGALYLAMTWSSAARYWRGERSRWKGRVYRASPCAEDGPDSDNAVV
ncbi:MAG: glycosyltransferase [Gammaproteobacteria bacterium]|nr:glycosyltransferase [Gammaproteobacteria bacterium]NIR83039.1 glycosyltransferase [Gammaproteobacteria bacterium]NIR90701.1 glycosyltransferase [Gammaproteobacteria bacterium]NIU04192.1 glycosyltransferase [Gammaproteobacteria bacterium]NIV51484.1 glycosyltransferase [Gammaproteobacteria bacterium]